MTKRRRAWAAWRERARGRIKTAGTELKCVAESPWVPCGCHGWWNRPTRSLLAAQKIRVEDAQAWLAEAEETVNRRPSLGSAWNGIDVENAWGNIHEAEAALVRLSHPVKVKAMIPTIIANARQVLEPTSAQLTALDEYNKKSRLTPDDQESLAECVSAVYERLASEYVRARSFRNVLFATSFVMTVLAVGLGILAALRPEIFASAEMLNTSAPRLELWEAEVLGLIGASIVGSVAIRRMRGTSTPYAIPMASLLLKLPTGALTSTAGLMLIHAGFLSSTFVPASMAQSIAYAVILGGSQQTFTRFIDHQAQTVLDNVPSFDRDDARTAPST